MILAYIIYIFLCLFMFGNATLYVKCCKRNCRIEYWNIATVLSIAFFSIIFGFRYDVGIDYLVYYSAYVDQFKYVSIIDWEPSFVALYRCLYYLNAAPEYLFVLICFIQIVIFYNIFKDKGNLLPYAVLLLFITGYVFGMLNTLRQSTAVLILLFSIKYMYTAKVWRLFFCIIIATTFHISALSFIPVIFFFYLRRITIIDNKWIHLSVYLLCILMQPHIYNFMLDQFIVLLTNSSDYSLPLIGGVWQTELGSGLGRMLNYVIVIILILMSKTLYEKFGLPYLQYYRVFYWGQLLLVIAGLDMNFRRIAMCYTGASLLVLSYFFYFIFTYWKSLPIHYKLVGSGVMGLYLLMFLQKIYVGESQCSPFNFIF